MKRHRESVPLDRKASVPQVARKELLLYVEDDQDNWEVAELRLAKNYDLLHASNDEEACRIIRERWQEIDVVLMDIELRGSELNGVELTELLRGNRLPDRAWLPAYARDLPALSKPIVFVTAHGTRYTSVQLMLSGANRVITKPVNFPDLHKAISELLSERTSY